MALRPSSRGQNSWDSQRRGMPASIASTLHPSESGALGGSGSGGRSPRSEMMMMDDFGLVPSSGSLLPPSSGSLLALGGDLDFTDTHRAPSSMAASPMNPSMLSASPVHSSLLSSGGGIANGSSLSQVARSPAKGRASGVRSSSVTTRSSSCTGPDGFSPSMFLRSSPFRLPTFTNTHSDQLLDGQQSSPRPVRAK